MNLLLELAFIFFIGSTLGWCIEVIYRRFFSSVNPTHKWINPGFCTGPYLPLYGFGLCLLYEIADLERLNWLENSTANKLLLFLMMALCMTLIEYVAGLAALKIMKVRLWDYRHEWGNIQGIICPKFSLMWAALGALYYFLIHHQIVNAVRWLSQNLTFSFVIGMFYGILLIDAAASIQLVTKLKKFAEENNIVVRYETLKTNIRQHYDNTKHKYHFFRPFRTERPLTEHLKEMVDSFEQRLKNRSEQK